MIVITNIDMKDIDTNSLLLEKLDRVVCSSHGNPLEIHLVICL